MSKADEMFEELGYQKSKYCDGYWKLDDEINFNKQEHTVEKFNYLIGKGISESVPITMKELQAINEKCKEWGWIND